MFRAPKRAKKDANVEIPSKNRKSASPMFGIMKVKSQRPREEKELPGDESEPDDDEKVEDVDKLKKNDWAYRINIPEWAQGFDVTTRIPDAAYKNDLQIHGDTRHMTKKAAVGSGKSTNVCPPMHEDWPIALFKKNMAFDQFISVISTDEKTREIMKWETDFESVSKSKLIVLGDAKKGAKKKKKGDDGIHFGRKLQWKSWSAMLQLELTYPTLMKSCLSWETCFEHMWKSVLSKPTSAVFKRVKKSIYVDKDLGLLAYLNSLIHHVWANSGKVDANSVRTFIRNKIMGNLKESDMWVGSEKEWSVFVRYGPISLPDDVAAALRQAGEAVVTRALQAPQTIHESLISSGVKRLVLAIWGPDMDTSIPVDLSGATVSGLSDKAKAVSCLLELLCGSRMVGLLLVNWFDRIETATMEEWEKDKLPTSFGSLGRCVSVTRLSKEGTRAAREEKVRKATGEENVDVQDRVIVKPLNTMFLDRVFLAPERGFSRTMNKESDAVKICLHLIQVLREYIFEPHRGPSKGLASMSRGGVLGLTDELAERIPKKGRDWLNGLEQRLGLYARKVFPGMFKKNQGTHLLRKIYMIWSFNAFASKSMKETGYASAVLGHRGFKVSLNYTSLLIERSISGDIKNEGAIMKMLELLQKRVDGLTIKLEAERKKQTDDSSGYVTFETADGPVEIRKADRLPRDSKIETVKERVRTVSTILRVNGVFPSASNLAKLGVWIKNKKEETTKKDMKA
jgi:hypothetical protein